MNFLVLLAATEGSEQAGGVAALGIDVKALILQLVTFGLIFLILKKFAFAPILKALEDRREKINEGLKLAEDMDKRQDEVSAEVDKKLAAARKEAEQVIANSQKEAGSIIEEASERATKRAEEIAAEQIARFEREVAKARTELKGEVLGLVADATEMIIDEKLDSKHDQELLAKTLKGRL